MNVFIAGGTGYMGRALSPVLVSRGHTVRTLVRKESESKVPDGIGFVNGNALDAETFSGAVTPADTYVHMIGVSHPSPSKAREFREIDLPAVRASVNAALLAAVKHFVYVSVAHPAPVMKEYAQTRIEAEAMIRDAGLNATFVRPWYVLGPGHRWAYALLPFYWILKKLPPTAQTAKRLDLVTLPQMIAALVFAIENPVMGIREMNVPEIQSSGLEVMK